MSISFGPTIPFVDELGFVMDRFEGGQSTLLYTPRPEHCNSFAVTHGGAVMTLLDVSMATAARSMQQDMGVVTIEMKTAFMRPAPAKGQALRAEGRLLHRSRTMAFCETSLFDAEGNLCAHATGTFKYMPRDAGSATATSTATAPQKATAT